MYGSTVIDLPTNAGPAAIKSASIAENSAFVSFLAVSAGTVRLRSVRYNSLVMPTMGGAVVAGAGGGKATDLGSKKPVFRLSM